MDVFNPKKHLKFPGITFKGPPFWFLTAILSSEGKNYVFRENIDEFGGKTDKKGLEYKTDDISGKIITSKCKKRWNNEKIMITKLNERLKWFYLMETGSNVLKLERCWSCRLPIVPRAQREERVVCISILRSWWVYEEPLLSLQRVLAVRKIHEDVNVFYVLKSINLLDLLAAGVSFTVQPPIPPSKEEQGVGRGWWEGEKVSREKGKGGGYERYPIVKVSCVHKMNTLYFPTFYFYFTF